MRPTVLPRSLEGQDLALIVFLALLSFLPSAPLRTFCLVDRILSLSEASLLIGTNPRLQGLFTTAMCVNEF